MATTTSWRAWTTSTLSFHPKSLRNGASTKADFRCGIREDDVLNFVMCSNVSSLSQTQKLECGEDRGCQPENRASLLANETLLAEELESATCEETACRGRGVPRLFSRRVWFFSCMRCTQANGNGWRHSRKLASSAWCASVKVRPTAPCVRCNVS